MSDNLPQMSEASDLRPEITVGSILGRSLSTLIKNFPVFVVIALVFNIPAVLIGHWANANMKPTTASFVNNLSNSLFGGLVTGAVLFGVVESMRGAKADLGKCISVAISRIVPIFFVSLLYGIGVAVGTMLLIIPGIILACMWYVAVPATVVEKTGIIDSFGRSAELTKGHRMTLFLAALVFFGVSILVGMLVVAPMIAAEGGVVMASIIGLVLAVTVGLWGNVAMGVVYHDLRVAKEGVSTDQIAEVFA